MQIGVIGDSGAKGELYGLAEEVGREVARCGSTLLCGGLGGVMEAACKGAKEEGGTTVGILPGSQKAAANQYVDVKITTAMGHARNAIIAGSADVLIAVGGGMGTLSEVALGLKMGKPVIVLDVEGVRDIVERIGGPNVHLAKDARGAVELALSLKGAGK